MCKTPRGWIWDLLICFLNPLSKIFLHWSYFALIVFKQLSATFFLLEKSMNVVDAWFVCKCTRIADSSSANVYPSCVGQEHLILKFFSKTSWKSTKHNFLFCTSHWKMQPWILKSCIECDLRVSGGYGLKMAAGYLLAIGWSSQSVIFEPLKQLQASKSSSSRELPKWMV